MAAYDTLRAAIDSYIKANGNKEITGTVLNDILNAMVSALGADTRFAGVAVPTTNPGNPEGNVVYFASQAGTYSNFGGIVLPLGIHILVWNGTAWTSQTWFSVDNTPTQNSQNLATSGGILQAIVDAVGVERLRAIGAEVTSCSFDGTTKKISFFNSADDTLFQLDATAFVIDGMVSDVKIEDGNLVIQFNTDAGKQDIEIPLTDIFNPANYYTKTAIDALLALYYTKTETDALLTAINNKLADGCLYRGMAEPTTNPPTPSTKVFYIATKAGTYTNFGNIAVTEGITILKYDGSNWSKEQISYSDGVFDISAYNGTSYADLSAALGTNGANIPENLRKGGMSVKFVQSSDNKYVQYRLMSDSFNTTPTNWQGVDDEPTAGSDNLITSGGVAQKITRLDVDVNGTISKVGYYLNSSGQEVEDANYGISIYIPVEPNTTYTWLMYGSYATAVKACVYNSSKSLIDYYSRGGDSGASINTRATGAYIRVTYGVGSEANNKVKLGDEVIWTPIKGLSSRIENAIQIAEKAVAETSYYNVTDNVPLESGYYTLATAIAAIPQAIRKKGLHIIFAFNAVGWSHYWFNGGNTTSSVWTNTANWMKEKTGIVCLTYNPVNFDLVNKKMVFPQYGTIPKLLVGGSVVEIASGTEIDITSSYENFSIIYDAKTNTFSTASLGTILYNEQYYFAHIIGNVVFAHPVVLNYTINGYPPTVGNATKGDVGYIANVIAAEFDFEDGTLTFPGYPDSTKVYANGRASTFTNTSGLTIQLAGTNNEGVIVYDFADSTIKTYIRTSAYTAPATSVLIGWYNAVRKTAYLAGRYTIRGQHDYWDYSDLPTYIKDGISAHIAKVCQGVEDADLVFDFITDVQNNNIYGGSRICYIEAINAGMKVSKFIVNGGDFVSGLPTAGDDIDHMSQMYAAHKKDIGAKDLFMCQGNHDGTWQKWNSTSHQVKAKDIVTDKTWTNMFLKNIDGAVYDSANPLGGYLYKDYEDRKVRVIILNTCDICVCDNNGYLKYNAMYDNAVRQQQLDWLVNYALDFTDKGADKTNWGILVFTHFGVDVDNEWFPHGASLVEDVLQAFKSGTAITQSSEWGDADFQLVVNHDFSAQGAMNYIAYIHGHTHTDRVLFNNGVPHIATASANGVYDSETPPVGGTCPPREEGTLSYYCYDTMQYDKQNNRIIAYRFGAGADRYINNGINSVSVGNTITLTSSLSGTLTWSIYAKSGANIASINNGVVTGIASGNATACAEDEDGVKEFFSIVVA